MEWLIRMKDALDLIEANIEERLDIETIAKAAYSSPFHFQRMFNMVTGFTLADYVRKRRLTLAAQELAVSSAKVIDVAVKYGYETPEAFSKAFRKLHGITPSAAREPGVQLKAFPRISFHLSLKGDKDMDYRIVDRDGFTVVGKSIPVSMRDGENNQRIPQFWQECYRDGTIGKLHAIAPNKGLFGICMGVDHQNERFTYAIAVEDGTGTKLDGFESCDVPAATWAVFPSLGPLPSAIQSVWERIFQEWFPATGYEHAGGPELEVLPPGDDSADDYRCEVWIPIVKK